MLNNTYYDDFFEIGQQKISLSLYELGLPSTDPVYTLKKVMEELDYLGLLSRYLDKGRKGYNPIMLYAVVTYANMRGIRAVDRIVELSYVRFNLLVGESGQVFQDKASVWAMGGYGRSLYG